MKRALPILLIMILFLGLVSCSDGAEQDIKPSNGIDAEINILRTHCDYFDTEIVEEIGAGTYIIRDKNTDVLYLVVGGHYSAIITPIYNADGTLKLYEQEE